MSGKVINHTAPNLSNKAPRCAFVRDCENGQSHEVALHELSINPNSTETSDKVHKGVYRTIEDKGSYTIEMKVEAISKSAFDVMYRGINSMQEHTGSDASGIETLNPTQRSKKEGSGLSCFFLCHPYRSAPSVSVEVIGGGALDVGTDYTVEQDDCSKIRYVKFLNGDADPKKHLKVTHSGPTYKGHTIKDGECNTPRVFDMILKAYGCDQEGTIYLDNCTASEMKLTEIVSENNQKRDLYTIMVTGQVRFSHVVKVE